MSSNLKILTLHDSPHINSGFGRVADNLLSRWAKRGAIIDCMAIGFNGMGYKEVPYVNQLIPADAASWHTPRMLQIFCNMIETGTYDAVFIMQDHFHLSEHEDFCQRLREICAKKKAVSVYYFPVDATMEPEFTLIMQAVDYPVAYTRYGMEEAKRQAERRESSLKRMVIIPHGINTELYKPLANRKELRSAFYTPSWPGPDDFLLLNVNTMQRRKDPMRSLEILKGLLRAGVPAKLIMHMPNISLDELTRLELIGPQLGLIYSGVESDWAHNAHYFPPHGRVREPEMHKLYNIADMYLSTTLGEGWGLGAIEALACGLPIALPSHTACAEIMEELDMRGMGDRCVPLPIEKHGVVLPLDNSRVRYRTDVDGAVRAIAEYYESGKWKDRPGLAGNVKEWLSWERIARQFWRLFKREKLEAEPPYPIQEKPRGSAALPAPAFPEPVSKNAVPVMACPVYNRPDLLQRMVRSIDFPVMDFLTMWNGPQHELMKNAFGGVAQIGKLKLLGQPGTNQGCASSWNTIVWHALKTLGAPYVLICSNDVVFAPGDLQKIHAYVMEHLDHAVLFAHAHNCFAITPKNLEQVGEFDWNFWPAYLEDCDHMRRVRLSGALSANIPDLGITHGEERDGKPHQGSCSIYSDEVLHRLVDVCHRNNRQYYILKWGGDNEKEVYKAPYGAMTTDQKRILPSKLLRKANEESCIVGADELAKELSKELTDQLTATLPQ